MGRFSIRYLGALGWEGMWRRCVFFFSKVRFLSVVVVGGGAAVAAVDGFVAISGNSG